MKIPNWRNFIRFRLRTMLLVFTCASIWLGLHVHRARLQEESVAAIRQYGGWVRYDFQFPSGQFSYKDFDAKARSWVPGPLLDALGMDFFHDVVQVNLNYSEDSGKRQENHNPSDDALQYLRGFPKLRTLLLSDTQASDMSMRHLASLKHLQYLWMWDVSNVSDAGVAHLDGLKELRYIHLTTSQITDRSLAVFAEIPKLEGLCLQFNEFTDEGLRHIAGLTQLESLWVCGKGKDSPNGITDAGLRHLQKLNKLSELAIQNTRVTPTGIKSLSQVMPACKVIH
jgi:hypothetical protein